MSHSTARTLILTLAIAACAAPASVPAPATPAAPAPRPAAVAPIVPVAPRPMPSTPGRVGGWIDLLENPGAHWRGYQLEGFPRGWIFDPETKVLSRTGNGGDLVSKREFGDFELYVEWMISPRGNSGVFFRATEDTRRIYENAPEAQILDNQLNPEGGNPITAAGSNYALHSSTIDAAFSADVWNKMLIIVRGAHVEHWLNGHQVVSYDLWTDHWRQLVANSKFAQWPSYGLARRGRIGLQDHGDVVSFRSIQIREFAP